MDPNRVMALARSLMIHHGVGYLQFGFHHYPDQPKVIGKSHTVESNDVRVYSKITLDTEWVKVLPEHKIREVTLHEIAHVHTPITAEPHGPVWKRNCIKLGIPPNQFFKWYGPVALGC